MKKLIIGLFLSISFLSPSCNNDKTVDENEITYRCPMKCEGEKTYAEEGSCPECGMDLVVLDEEGEH